MRSQTFELSLIVVVSGAMVVGLYFLERAQILNNGFWYNALNVCVLAVAIYISSRSGRRIYPERFTDSADSTGQ